jgi:hypothetical protein
MLSKPEYGWTTVTIGNFSGPAGYLSDVPIDCLESMISHIKNPHIPFCVDFDAEGWEFTVVAKYGFSYVIEEKDVAILHSFEHDWRWSLAQELIDDIRSDLEEWVFWMGKEYFSDEETEDRRKYIVQLCNEIEDHLKNGK